MSLQKNGSNIEAMKVVFQAHSGRWRNKSIKDKENIYWNDTGKKKFNGRHRHKGKNIFSVAHKGMQFCQEHIRDLIFFMKDKL
jgi:hypothetical protein